jgi:hypothetical protein
MASPSFRDQDARKISLSADHNYGSGPGFAVPEKVLIIVTLAIVVLGMVSLVVVRFTTLLG